MSAVTAIPNRSKIPTTISGRTSATAIETTIEMTIETTTIETTTIETTSTANRHGRLRERRTPT